jgi:pyruvate/2-oxoglutarate dehydrogenase complex dihydrolipoamide dehydrogenase (E3) component
MKASYEYDLVVVGLGPAGMAAAAMASEMGLKVCGVEANKIAGECMNVGCIPSKALL